ncbi:MAG: hypothetical protein M5U34_16675 [Chloroflexi bacterium]|nr:hypothetical protein [Chloroflexota bacterium]
MKVAILNDGDGRLFCPFFPITFTHDTGFGRIFGGEAGYDAALQSRIVGIRGRRWGGNGRFRFRRRCRNSGRRRLGRGTGR